jgi:transposase
MSYEIHADHTQQFLLPPALEDWVPADHPVRFIRDFVAQLDLKALGFYHRDAEPGRPNYSSELLLSVWLYGYLENIRSSRKLEHACRNHMALIWLTGMHYPDHNTLWRFWKAHRKALRGVFRHSVTIAQHLGLLGMVVHALDGTKIAVHSSPESALHRGTLEEWYAAVEASIAAMESALEAENGRESPSVLPASLHEAQQRRAAIQEAMALLDAQEQKQVLPAEEEARMMKMHGRIGWGYNAQAVVDDAHGIVVGAEVSPHAADSEHLVYMLDTVAQTTGDIAGTTVADAGYRSTAQEMEASERGHAVLLPGHGGRDADNGSPYHKDRFVYDADTDSYTCPEGKPLRYSHHIAARGHKAEARVYRCRECQHCPVRTGCTRNRNGRTLRRDLHEDFLEQQRQARMQPQAQALLRRRKAIIEPLFGHIKENMGFRRWTARGLENARAQWAMLCLAVNLKKLYQRWSPANGPKNGPAFGLKTIPSVQYTYKQRGCFTFYFPRLRCSHIV